MNDWSAALKEQMSHFGISNVAVLPPEENPDMVDGVAQTSRAGSARLSLDIAPSGQDYQISAVVTGSQYHDGNYRAFYATERGRVGMVKSEGKFPLNVQSSATSLADAISFVTDYFERHGCFL